MNIGGRLQRADHRLEGTSQIDPVEAEADFDHHLHGGWSMHYHAGRGDGFDA